MSGEIKTEDGEMPTTAITAASDAALHSASVVSDMAAGTSRAGSRPKKKARTKKEGSSDAASASASVTRASSVADVHDEGIHEGGEGDEEGEDVGEDSTSRLLCVCQSLYDDERMMIACDRCDDWYHTACMNIADEQVDLVEVFICPHCTDAGAMQHTKYKPKCLRAGCTRAAVQPLSRYCSERCGILVVGARIQKAAKVPAKGLSNGGGGSSTAAANAAAKKAVEKLLQSSRIASAHRREGIVIWEGEAGAKDKMGAWLDGDASWQGHEQLQAELVASGASSSADEIDAADVSFILPLLEELRRMREQSEEVRQQRKNVNTALDLLAARTKLLQLADDRAATLEPVVAAGEDEAEESSKSKKSKSKKKTSDAASASAAAAGGPLRPRGQPRCGYDERLGWDDARFRTWSNQDKARAMLDEAEPLDGHLDDGDETQPASPAAMDTDDAGAASTIQQQPRICGQIKRKCRRHADWTAVRGADYEYERDLQTQLLARLGEQDQTSMARIVTLQRAVRQTLHDARTRRQNADEILARRLANEGTRRAAPIV